MLLKTVRFIILSLDWYLPKESGFDSSFMLDVLRGRKKYWPLSVSSDFNLPYFKSDDTLTKKYIIDKINGNNAYKDYIPDGINLEKLSRKFLLAVRNII